MPNPNDDQPTQYPSGAAALFADHARAEIEHDVKLSMISAMKRYGGSFVVALSECFLAADANNFARLCKAFPEYVEQYLAMACIDDAEHNIQPTEEHGG